MTNVALDVALALIREMEEAILGLQQLSPHLPDNDERKRLDTLIAEAETKLAVIKRQVIQ